MINQADVLFVKNLLLSKGIDKIVDLNGKYFDAFVDVLCWNYRNTDSEIWVNSKYQRIGKFHTKAFVSIFGALLSWFLFTFKYRKLRVKRFSSRIVAFPFGGDHVRFKYVFDLLGEDIAVMYPPLYHYGYIQKHIECFEQQDKAVFVGHFSLLDILYATYVLLKSVSRIRECHYQIDNYFERGYGSLTSVVVSSILYRRFIIRALRLIPKDGLNRCWFFDYDFDYKYIVFNDEIKKNRNDDVTFHVQHGAFLGYNDAYCNPVSDVSLCCSKREQSIIESSNKYNSIICPQGSSWQSIDKSAQKTESSSIKYDILILLTDTLDQKLTQFQKKILGDLSELNSRVLARYRPQSIEMDKRVLQDYVKNMDVSDGTTLKQDILCSRLVLCFSEDAIFECFRNNKKVVFLTKDASCYVFDITPSQNMQIMSSETYNIKNVVSLLDNPICDYSQDSFVKYNFGDFSFEDVKRNLNIIIKRFQ